MFFSSGPSVRRFRPQVELLESRATPTATFGFALGMGASRTSLTVGDTGRSVTTDAAGNAYIIGFFNGTVDFDPGTGTAEFTSSANDCYVAKYSASGDLVWARQFVTTSFVEGYGITVDQQGNVYTTGDFSGVTDFDPGPGTFNLTASVGGADIFVSKLDSNGNFLSAHQFAGRGQAHNIVLDGQGNIYTTGYFGGTVDFDPGSGVVNLTSIASVDAFICKLDNAANFVWARQFADSTGWGIDVDSNQNVYTTGQFSHTVDFNPGSGSFNLTSAGLFDSYVSKLDSGGNFAWAIRSGGSGEDYGRGLAVDSTGNIYTSDFDGTHTAVTKFDVSGNIVWSDQIDSRDGFDLALDARGNVFVIGVFMGTQDFDPGPGTFVLTSAGDDDAYVLKLDNAGNFVWAVQLGGSGLESAYGVAVDPAGHVYSTGGFENTADFDPGAATYELTSAGSLDIYLSQLVDDGVLVSESGYSTDVTEGGATDSYSIVLTKAPTANVLITLNPDSQVTVSRTSLLFTLANWNVPQTVTVAAVDDQLVEGNHTGTIAATVTSADNSYNGIAVRSVRAHIADNDGGGSDKVTITPSGGSTDVSEDGATDTYTVALTSQPTGNVTITINAGGQVRVSPTSLVFSTTNWNVPRVVTVTAVDDTAVEGNETITISHVASSSDPNYRGLNLAGLPVNVTDNDEPTVKFTSADGVLGILEGASRTYRAALSGAPAANVTVTLAPDAALLLSVSELVFTPTNWNTPQTITITALDNDLLDGNRLVSIVNSTSSADAFFDGLALPDTDVMVIDNENTLVVAGTGSSDTISVLFSPSLIQIVVNGRSTFAPTTFTQVLVQAGSGNDLIKLGNPSIPVAVLAASGTDTVQIDGGVGANSFDVDTTVIAINSRPVALGDTENVILNGKGAEDTFTVSAVPAFAVSLQGFGGLDRIIGPDDDTLWKITGTSAGTLAGTITFGTVENLTGGAGDDRFVFLASKSIGGQIDGGAGNNILDYSTYKSVVTANLQTGLITGARGFANIASLIGGSALDKIIGANTANVWNISGANSGDIGGMAFTGFENLTGGSDDDSFVFADAGSLRGKIDGGVGADTLDYTTVAANLTVNLQIKIATRTGGWLNLENFVGGQGTNALIGRNAASTWTLSSLDAGTVTGGFSFAGFQNLTGGTLADLFDLTAGGEWSGLLDGGAGLDSLTSSSGGVYINTGLNAGTLNGRAFRNVERRQ